MSRCRQCPPACRVGQGVHRLCGPAVEPPAANHMALQPLHAHEGAPLFLVLPRMLQHKQVLQQESRHLAQMGIHSMSATCIAAILGARVAGCSSQHVL